MRPAARASSSFGAFRDTALLTLHRSRPEDPFSYFPVGNIFYDAFAARFPRCTEAEAFDANGACVSYANDGGCCDITNSIAPTDNGRNGAIFFSFLIFGGSMFAVIHSFISASRFIYSFARDRGFPGPLSTALAYVEPRTKAPLGAIIAFLFLGVAFVVAWTNPSPSVAFAAVSGINANAFLLVYGLPSLLRATVGLKSFRPAPEFSLGWLSVPMAIISAAYGTFSNATIALPNLFPQSTNTVNYAPIALAAVIILVRVICVRLVAPAAPPRVPPDAPRAAAGAGAVPVCYLRAVLGLPRPRARWQRARVCTWRVGAPGHHQSVGAARGGRQGRAAAA